MTSVPTYILMVFEFLVYSKAVINTYYDVDGDVITYFEGIEYMLHPWGIVDPCAVSLGTY